MTMLEPELDKILEKVDCRYEEKVTYIRPTETND